MSKELCKWFECNNAHDVVISVSSYIYKTQGFDEKTEGKRPLRRPRLRWKDGIGMDIRVIGWGVYSGSGWLRIGAGGGFL
jgi:hypothetical protein